MRRGRGATGVWARGRELRRGGLARRAAGGGGGAAGGRRRRAARVAGGDPRRRLAALPRRRQRGRRAHPRAACECPLLPCSVFIALELRSAA